MLYMYINIIFQIISYSINHFYIDILHSQVRSSFHINEENNELSYNMVYLGQFKDEHFCGHGIYYHENGMIKGRTNFINGNINGHKLLYHDNGIINEIE